MTFENNKIKVLVIDDSVIFRRVMANAVESDDALELIGTAEDPFDAVKIIEKNCPDVITLDIEMPNMDGLTFLEKLMSQHPIPVIIVSSLTKGNRGICLDAYNKGAIDVVNKPTTLKSNVNLKEFYEYICDKVKGAAQANVKRHQKVLLDLSATKNEKRYIPKIVSSGQIIAIGASAGGTSAIEMVLRNLPDTMPGIVITQHMPKGFTKLFADRLNTLCSLEVQEAIDNQVVRQGLVLIAPGDKHMMVVGSPGNFKVRLVDSEPVNRHKPSVDVMFYSVADVARTKAVGVILTGMGADGAKGLLKMKHLGAHTIAQDKESCVVYGMPYQAVLLEAQNEIVSLKAIPQKLVSYFQHKRV